MEWVRGSVWGGMKNVVVSEVAGQTRWPWDGAGSTAGLVLKVFLLNYFILITELSRFLIIVLIQYIINNHQINNNLSMSI